MDKVAAALKKALQPGKYVLAFSGGADSVALVLGALELVKLKPAYSFLAVHVEHGIRGAEALRDLEFARNFCQEQGMEFQVCHVDVPARVAATGESVEAAARALRYEALFTVRRSCQAIRVITAHHANDQAETLLLHLVRGSVLRGLCGMDVDNGHIVRPLLDFTKQELLDYCQAHQASWVEDSSNSDLNYSRNYLRHQVVPLLEKLNPALVRNLRQMAKSLQEDEDVLDLDGVNFLSRRSRGKMLLVERWGSVPAAVRKRALRTWLEGRGVAISWTHIENVDKLILKNVSYKELALPAATVLYADHKLYLELDAQHIRH